MVSELTSTVQRCTNCSGPLIEISISLEPSGPMSMRSCSTCDIRYWHRQGEVTSLAGVLDIMADERIPTRRGSAARSSTRALGA